MLTFTFLTLSQICAPEGGPGNPYMYKPVAPGLWAFPAPASELVLRRMMMGLGLLRRFQLSLEAPKEPSQRRHTPARPAVCGMHQGKIGWLDSSGPSNTGICLPFWKKTKKILEASGPPTACGNQRGRSYSKTRRWEPHGQGSAWNTPHPASRGQERGPVRL